MNNNRNVKTSTTTMKIVYFYEKLIGVCPYRFAIGKNRHTDLKLTKIDVTYNVVLILFYTWIFSIVIINRLNLHLPSETTLTIAMDALALLFQYATVITTWIVTVCYKNKAQIIIDKLRAIELSTNDLNVNLNRNDEITREISLRLVLVNFLYLFLFCVDHFSLLDYPDFQREANSWFLFSTPKLVYYNVYVIFLEFMTILRQNYKSLNDALLIIFINDKNDEDDEEIILAYGRFHEILNDLTNELTLFFRLPVFNAIAATFIHSFLDVYSIYQLLNHGRLDFSVFNMNLLWLATKILGVYFVCAVPDFTCREV